MFRCLRRAVLEPAARTACVAVGYLLLSRYLRHR